MMQKNDFNNLRARHPELTFEGWQTEHTATTLTITFSMVLEPDIRFSPQITLPQELASAFADLSDTEQTWWLLHLGMAELPSYWKVAASPSIRITAPGSELLTNAHLDWWRELFLKGLGEYYFVNDIASFAESDFLTISTQSGAQSSREVSEWLSNQSTATPTTQAQPTSNSFLIPLGGGKDSVVTTQPLTSAFPAYNSTILLLNPTQAAQDIATASGLKTVIVRRRLDPQLLQLNSQGYLNGHTPFSSYLAFVSTLVARLLQIETVVLSNEHSANESNIIFHNLEINHQYSKSLAFEMAFERYLQKYAPWQSMFASDQHHLPVQPHYLSLLRPLSELQIGSLFSHLTGAKRSLANGLQASILPELRSLFRSCNRGSKQNIWCGECPKCLFAYIMLAPFLGRTEMIEIFGQDLFSKPSLLETALELAGKSAHKPLECVGLYEESLIGLYLSKKVWERELSSSGSQQPATTSGFQALPVILSHFAQQIFPQEVNLDQRAASFKTFWAEHQLPPDLAHLVQQAVTDAQIEWPV